MQITDIRIRKVESEGKLKAYVTVTFDGCFVVHNVKVIEGRSGVFIAMPSMRTKSGEYKDVAHPINSEFRGLLQSHILEAYEQEMGREDSDDTPPSGDPGPPTDLPPLYESDDSGQSVESGLPMPDNPESQKAAE